MKSVNVYAPQSLNLYAYVRNNPIDFKDPTGLYEACAHEAMTYFLGNLAGFTYTNKVAGYTGEGLEAADSHKWKASRIFSFAESALFGTGSTNDIHFPSKERLESEIKKFPDYVKKGNLGNWRGYQAAGFVLHSIQDSLGAHAGYSPPWGHGSDIFKGKDPHETDRILGSDNFIAAANRTYQVMKGNDKAGLTNRQINDLINAILARCKSQNIKFTVIRPVLEKPPRGIAGGGGGGGGVSNGGGGYRLYAPPSSWFENIQDDTIWDVDVSGGVIPPKAS